MSRTRVGLLVTCMCDMATPGPALAARQILSALGDEVVMPKNQTCCGQPALNSGFDKQAAAVMASWVHSIPNNVDAIVTPAGSCAAFLHHYAATLLPKRLQSKALAVQEFTQYVAPRASRLDLKLDATVTYHDSCHMTRMLPETTTPRQLLGQIDGLQLVEMDGSDTCCGFGGTFSVKFPELSTAMGDVKLANATRTQADYMVSADPGCLLHLSTRRQATQRDIKPGRVEAHSRAGSFGAGPSAHRETSGSAQPRLIHIAELTRKAMV